MCFCVYISTTPLYNPVPLISVMYTHTVCVIDFTTPFKITKYDEKSYRRHGIRGFIQLSVSVKRVALKRESETVKKKFT